jgi:hypothetical protein
MSNDLILRAARLATTVHNGQNRKWGHSADPYIFHPMRVAGLVSLNTFATEEIVAAWLNTTALALVVETPQRLKIGMMEALGLLYRVFQVKRRTRNDVVYVPSPVSIVVPSHTRLEEGFKMMLELFKSATEKFQSRLRFVDSPKRLPYANSQIYRQTETHVAVKKSISCKVCLFSSTGGSPANPISSQDFNLIRFISSLACDLSLFGAAVFAGFLNLFFSISKIISSFDLLLADSTMTMNSKSAMFTLVEVLQRLVPLTSSAFLFHRRILSNAVML